MIIVAATNLIDILDPAVIREGRFDYKIEVDNPDYESRLHLLRTSIKRVLPTAEIVESELVSTAKRLNGFSVKRIMANAERLPTVLDVKSNYKIGHQDFMSALRHLQGTKGRIPDDSLPLSELVLRDDLRQEITDLLFDLKNIEKMEEFGGEVPRGVFLYGPPGTGKTTVAKTLSKESSWALISVSGPDLIANRNLLDEIYNKAKNLRPTIIFIDEATEVVKNRTMSMCPEITNKLLTIMDGFDDRVKDVLFLAATNHPEDVDPALIRSGRFSGKMEFTQPSSDELRDYASSWINQRASNAILSDEVCFDDILRGRYLSPADVKGLVQTALNNAIRDNSFFEDRVCIQQAHFDRSLRFLGL